MIEIDRESMVPPYRQIADALRHRIASAEIPVGRRIPSVVELEQETGGAARNTIQKAVQVLRDEGLVQSVRGMGVYVIAVPGEDRSGA